MRKIYMLKSVESGSGLLTGKQGGRSNIKDPNFLDHTTNYVGTIFSDLGDT